MLTLDFWPLPWLGFCQSALPTKETEIKVVDYLGFAWKCSFRIVEAENELVFKIGGGCCFVNIFSFAATK